MHRCDQIWLPRNPPPRTSASQTAQKLRRCNWVGSSFSVARLFNFAWGNTQWQLDTGQGLVFKWPAQLPRNKQILGWNSNVHFRSTRPAAQQLAACQRTVSSPKRIDFSNCLQMAWILEFSFCWDARAKPKPKESKTLGPS